jgi:hypothetical protein
MAMRVNREPAKPPDGRHTADNQVTEDSPAPNNADILEQEQRSLAAELKVLIKQFRALGEYFSYFLNAEADSVRLSFRNLFLSAVLAAFGFVAIGGLIVIASWLILSSTAEGLGELFGHRSWIGSFITGFLLLIGLWGAMYYNVARRNRIAGQRTAKRYERLQTRQQTQFGERSFLANQAANSKTAMNGILHDMKDTLTRVADVRSCAKRHPWLIVVSAVAAGFVAGAVLPLAPPKNIKSAGSSTEPDSKSIRDAHETLRTKKSLAFSMMVTILAGTLQTVVKRWIATAIVAENQPQLETQSPLESTGGDLPPRRLFRFRSCSRGADHGNNLPR